MAVKQRLCKGHFQDLFYMWYSTIKTQPLIQFRNSFFRRIVFLAKTKVLKIIFKQV